MALELILTATAKYIFNNLAKYGYDSFLKNKSNLYEQELYEIIQKTIVEYAKSFPIAETEKIPFYQSQNLLELFLEFRFTKKLDVSLVKNTLDKDERIISPTANELEEFLNIFNKEIDTSKKLKFLNSEINFKEEIFKISEALNALRNEFDESIRDLKAQVKLVAVSAELMEEWNFQLDEISDELKSFKAYSAVTRLTKLEKRISDTGVFNNKLIARLLWLKSTCMDMFGESGIQTDHAELLIKIYKLQPQNEDYKSNAAQSYYVLGNVAEANKLADEILSSNEFNIVAWIVKIFIADKNFEEVLNTVPLSVRNKNIFRLHLYYWLSFRRIIKEVDDFAYFNLHFDIDYNKPVEISHRNLRYQLTLAQYLLVSFFNRNPEITANLCYSNAHADIQFKYGFQILQKIHENLFTSEIKNGYQYYFFYYFYCEFVLTQNKEYINLMGKAFEAVKVKDHELVVHMLQGYIAFGTRDYDLRALEIAENLSTSENEIITLFKANLYSLIDEKEKQIKAFIKYINMKPIVDRLFFMNFLSFVRTQLPQIPQPFKEAVVQSLMHKTFAALEYESLFRVFCFTNLEIGSFSEEELVVLIEKAKENIGAFDEDMQYEVALAFCLIKKPDIAKQYLKPKVDTRKYSKLLKLYCKVLYETNGDKPELLEILKYWRENSPRPDIVLLQMELDLRTLQHKWKEAIIISHKALEFFPDSEYFIHALFISLKNDFQNNAIPDYVHLVTNRVFKNEEMAINIAISLHGAGCYRDSIDLLYKHAILKQNLQSRHKYIQILLVHPEKMGQDFEIAGAGSFVKYQIGNKSEVLELTEENIKYNPGALFLGKKIGDTFSIKNRLTDLLVEITIERIFDKYSALFEELMLETENPLLGHVVQSFKFEDSSPEGMQKSFVDNFGLQGSLRKERVTRQFDLYYEGRISFTEIVISVFGQNSIDAYFTLINEQNKCYRAVAPSVNSNVQLSSKTKFVLDFTSICLFYDLSNELGFLFPDKFYISALLRERIAHNLEEIKIEPQSKLSISITEDGVIPYFYDDGFKKRRTELFQNILNWVDRNCLLEDVPERLNLITEKHDDNDNDLRHLDLIFNVIVESNMLANRPEHVMLTNDVFHYRHFKGSTNVFVSPFLYVEKYFPQHKMAAVSFMLRHNYIGLPITSQMLIDEFSKKNLNQENRFQICIENLNYGWNPDGNHIFEAITFLRHLYLQQVTNPGIRDITVMLLLKSLLTGMDYKTIKKTYQLFKEAFVLMATHSLSIQQLFYAVLSEMQTENKLS
ncbi:hypothetical protein QWZ08_00315 [Ferruginibacter paludis]|uniref:PIN domain-containing protein n=1 Tax=Ferruginibacter paludis TaxID=1310417 RepID=UPI0025B313F8|nr:hypothetical protein [Ferruginibacter paludis]MDN3654044.1 hypothetical protein [Ferruginibacter paludis]